jgi:hypothetical protein
MVSLMFAPETTSVTERSEWMRSHVCLRAKDLSLHLAIPTSTKTFGSQRLTVLPMLPLRAAPNPNRRMESFKKLSKCLLRDNSGSAVQISLVLLMLRLYRPLKTVNPTQSAILTPLHGYHWFPNSAPRNKLPGSELKCDQQITHTRIML